MTKAGFGDQSTKVTPFSANGRRAAAAHREIVAAGLLERDLGRQPRIGGRRGGAARSATGSPVGRDRDEGLVRRAPLSPRRTSVTAAPASRGMSNMSSKRAPGPIGNWLRSGSNGSLGCPSTATMNGLRAVDADVGQSRGRRVAEPKADARAGPRLEARAARRRRWRRRGRPCGPRPRASAGSAKSSLIWPRSSRLQSDKHDRDVLIDVGLFGLLDDDRPEQAAALLAGVGRPAVGQIEVEARIGRGEADVGACAGREPRPGQAAVAGAGVGRPQPGKAQRGRLGEPVDEPELQLLALLEAEERARRRAGVGEVAAGSAGGGSERKTRRARPRRGEIRPPPGNGVRRDARPRPQAAAARPPARTARRVSDHDCAISGRLARRRTCAGG